jgi:capsular polysaccharide transport system permease protein
MLMRIRAVHALIIRDLIVRFGRGHLGFVWTILEPMILTVGVMLVWSVIHGATIHGVPIIAFVLTGYMPLTVWRHMTSTSAKLLSNNSGLLYHRPITHSDILIARLLLEFFSTTAALIIIYLTVYSFGLVDPVYDFWLSLTGWVLNGAYYFGISLIIGAWTEIWEPAEKFIGPMNYLMLPISGVFFMVDWLPTNTQSWLLLNPSVNCFEMFRAGMLGEAVVTHYDTQYVLMAILIVNLIGAAVLFRVRDHIDVT